MIQEMLVWYNVLFYVALIIGVAFVLVGIMGVDFGGPDADFDMDAEVDGNVEHEGAFTKALSVLGLGRCPLSIVMFSALLIFGGTGFVFNQFLAPTFAVVSVVLAFVAMVFGTGFVAKTVSRFMPQTETYAIEPDHLIGLTGRVHVTVSETFGQVLVRDHQGSLHTLNARAYKGTVHPVGKRVFVVEHKDRVFYVDDNPQEIM